jgi:hypothetical protein
MFTTSLRGPIHRRLLETHAILFGVCDLIRFPSFMDQDTPVEGAEEYTTDEYDEESHHGASLLCVKNEWLFVDWLPLPIGFRYFSAHAGAGRRVLRSYRSTV